MLSYRHAFHADALKHSVLLSCLEYLRKKDTALLYVDTHAGAGAYKLDEGYAAQNREWAGGWSGIQNAAETLPDLPTAVFRYVNAVRAYQQKEKGPLHTI